MKNHPLARLPAEHRQTERIQALRGRKDRAARWIITIGGIGVVAAMLLILAYLVWVVLPLFGGAGASVEVLGQRPAWDGGTRHLAIDERGDLALRFDDQGGVDAFRLPGLESIERLRLPLAEGRRITAIAADLHSQGFLAAGLDDGQVLLLRHDFERLPGRPGVARDVVTELTFPYGEAPRHFARTAIDHLAVSERDGRLLVAALAGRRLGVEAGTSRTDFLTGETLLDSQFQGVDLGFPPTGLAVDGNHRWVYVGDDGGRLHRFDLPGLEPSGVLALGEAPLTAVAGLLGGVSVVAGDASGRVYQAFPVRGDDGAFELRLIREFEGMGAPVTGLLPELRRRGFVAVSDAGKVGVYHSTAGRKVLEQPLPVSDAKALAFAPRAEQLLAVGGDGAVARLLIDNPHPEATVSTLWRKTWYENYDEPRHIWQSTAANVDFEPKFSLAPLALGTLKAALFAMLFAVPLALMGATYTAVFMAPELRRKVKPAVELMAALPTVILGFLAGLWLAPFIEQHLAGLFAMLLVLPVGLLLFAFAWTHTPFRRHAPWSRGWEPVVLVPVIVALMALSLWLAEPLELWFFGRDLRDWLGQVAGVGYDQRNAIVVGIAMGISVVPLIFSIAEDALHAVPTSLSDGSLALGATRWQSLLWIVLPTASPGIFSGLMIGLGRAVGETMIVLMATGNTPLMSWNPLEGMRTLSANIAIEMPESSVAGTHFRVLFLSALVLFVFTFIVNTVAEVVRQRLRRRYASL